MGRISCPGDLQVSQSPQQLSDLALLPQNLNGVMVAVAELLSMKIPSSYEVLFPDSPMRSAASEPRKGEPDAQGEYPELGGALACPSKVLCW